MELASAEVSAGASSKTVAATAGLVEQKKARIRDLAEWDQLDRQQKRQLGLATTDTEWARTRNLNPRRVSKYRADPYYTEYTAQLADLTRKRISPSGSASLADVVSSAASGVDDVSDYAAIKTQVASLAKQGDQRALDLWLKHWGKPFLDEETAGRVVDLASLSDVELVSQLVSLVNVRLLSDVLSDAGWKVEAPCDRPASVDSV